MSVQRNIDVFRFYIKKEKILLGDVTMIFALTYAVFHSLQTGNAQLSANNSTVGFFQAQI